VSTPTTTPKRRQHHAPTIPATRAAYSVKDVCAVLGVSRPTVYKLIHTGQLRTVMIGRRRVVPVGEVDRILDGDA
jgi:excisionase family DNA binding protein